MFQQRKEALDDEVDNEDGSIQAKGQVIVGRGEELVAHDVGRGDAYQKGNAKHGGSEYPQVGEDSLTLHLTRQKKTDAFNDGVKRFQYNEWNCFLSYTVSTETLKNILTLLQAS